MWQEPDLSFPCPHSQALDIRELELQELQAQVAAAELVMQQVRCLAGG